MGNYVDRFRTLVREIQRQKNLYYNKGMPEVPDPVYDALEREYYLIQLELRSLMGVRK